jgi:hypothetical protein
LVNNIYNYTYHIEPRDIIVPGFLFGLMKQLYNSRPVVQDDISSIMDVVTGAICHTYDNSNRKIVNAFNAYFPTFISKGLI